MLTASKFSRYIMQHFQETDVICHVVSEKATIR